MNTHREHTCTTIQPISMVTSDMASEEIAAVSYPTGAIHDRTRHTERNK